MSRIDDLIAQHCPEGVQYVSLRELISYEQPSKYLVKTTDYDDSYSTPVLTAGQTFVLGRTNETAGIYPASVDSPVMIFDDFTTAFKWVDFPFKAKSSAMKMLTSINPSRASLRYIYFAMQTITYKPRDHARQWIGIYSKFKIPVPPLEVQQEIVRILDKFTQLEAELEAELGARQKQYAHYRNLQLGFGSDVPRKRVEEIAELSYGHTAKAADSGAFRFIRITDITDSGKLSPDGAKYVDISDADRNHVVQPGDLLMARTGATYGKTLLIEEDEPSVYASFLIRIRVDEAEVLPAFYWHFAQSGWFWSQADSMVSTGGQPQFNANRLKRVELPIPPLNEQARVVSLLNRFDALANDMSSGLPAEIAARRKQYEYYRDKLLTFEELPA